jgi:LytS/YehU family sensor histidine kinase
VEQIRFGSRLRMEENIDQDALGVDVPPLLLQPLVENAVAHGIANLIDGGWIRVNIARENGQLFIVVENQFDPEAPARRRNGVGLVNVRQRLETRYGRDASFNVEAAGESFRVSISIPTETEPIPA